MKNAFAIVTLSGLLTACAVAPQQQAAPTPQPAPAAAPVADTPPAPATEQAVADADQAQAQADTPDPEEQNLPSVPLTSELLYKIMKAELDFKLGHWQEPFITMMAAAQQTRDPRLARRAAEMALWAKRPEESLAGIRLWRELAPDSEEAAEYYLGFIVLSDKLDEAEAVFGQRLQDATPATRGLVIYQIQQFLTRAKNREAADALLERLMAPYGALPESHIALARAAFARGDKDEAYKQAQAALSLKPDSELALLTLAQASPDQDKVGEMLNAFLAAHPEATEVRAAHARVLVNQKQYAEARSEFERLLKAQPDNLNTLYALGIMSMQLNDYPVAEAHFKRFMDVLAAHPNDERDPSKVLMILSELAEDRGDLPLAMKWLEKVDSADPHAYFAAQLKHAQLIGAQGNVDAAQNALADLKTEDPGEQAQIVSTQAQVLREAGQNDAAYAVLEAGAKRFPTNPDLLYDFALMAEKTGHMDVMEASLREVFIQAPDNHQAYNALGYSLAERNIRLPEAYELIEKALKMSPDDPFILDSMGWVQYRLGHLKEAEEALRRAYSLRNDPEIAVHLGEVLWQQGRKADAHKLWREASKKDPKNDTLKSTLARLNQSL